MPEWVAVFTILGVGVTIIGSVIAMTYKLTRTVTEVDTTVRFLVANQTAHVAEETRIGESFRRETITRIDGLRSDLSRLELVVATKMGRGGNARSA